MVKDISVEIIMESDEISKNSENKNQNSGVFAKEEERLDKGALNGLRGLFAFHIMAFHAGYYVPGTVDDPHVVSLYAQVDMPLFFLLSGFSLALAYGKTSWNGSTIFCFGCKTKSLDGIDIENPDKAPKIFDSWEFYKKRLIRIFPALYLSHILVLIVWKFGVLPASATDMWKGLGLSVFAINTWVLPYQNFKPNETAWTISVLFFWYWCFPFILPRMQRLTDSQIARGIVKYFWLSVGLGILVYFGLGRKPGDEHQELIYWMVTAHPLVRFPVFLMGVLGGLQVLRAHKNWQNFEDPNLTKSLLHVVLPYSCCSKTYCCAKKKDCEKETTKAINKEKCMKIWRKRVDFSALLYTGLLAALCLTKVALDVEYEWKYSAEHSYNFWLDAQRNANGKFTWPNGTSKEFNEYTNWDTGEPGNWDAWRGKGICADDCVEKYAAILGEEYKWNYTWHDVPSNFKARVICQYEDSDSNNILDKYSSKTNSNSFGGKFYNISDVDVTHKTAKRICDDTGGTLLIVLDQNTADFIFGLITKTRLNKWVAEFFQQDSFWGEWLQLFAVHLQLTIVMGLCMDDGKSLTSRFLRTKVMQFLGRISLSLYLTHQSILGFVILAINGPREYETEAEIWEAYESRDLIEPPGFPLIGIITAPIVAFIVTKYFEEPISKILRGSK